MKIGVLALQGAFWEHRKTLEKLGAASFEIRQRRDIERSFDGLIIPGGESTTMGKLLRELDLYGEIKSRIEDGLPVFGTCAGMIILAKEIANDERRHLATMDITVRRNAYGRQIDSFYTEEDFAGEGKIPMTFIRAPYIECAGESVQILARAGGNIVAARQDNQLVTSFHPELNENPVVHEYFLNMIK